MASKYQLWANSVFPLGFSPYIEMLLCPNFFFSPRLRASAVSRSFETTHNLLHQRIRIALVLGDFGGEASDLCFRQALVQQPFQQPVAQHLDQAVAPA